MVELNGVRIWAVPAGVGSKLPPRRLVCGTLARPLQAGMGGASPVPPSPPPQGPRLSVPGRPDVVVPWTGWFELLTGEVVGVYGARVEPVG